MRQCEFFDRARLDTPPTPGRPIRLRQDADDLVVRGHERRERRHGELRGSGEGDAHGQERGDGAGTPRGVSRDSTTERGSGRGTITRYALTTLLLELAPDTVALQRREVVDEQLALEMVHLVL